MQVGNLKFAGATLALAAFVAGCSDSATTNADVPTDQRLASITVTAGQLGVCKYSVIPGSDPNGNFLSDEATSGTISVSANGTQLGVDSVIGYNTSDAQCRLFNLPDGSTTLAVTETPTTGSALYFWRYLIDGSFQDPYANVVPDGPSAGPYTINLSDISTTKSYQIWLKNTTYTPPPPSGGCTYTQGYWKTHSLAGPAGPYDDGWKNLAGGLEHNTIFFKSGKTWLALWNTPPRGSAYIQLAHQYMAAKLNVLNGASAPASVTSAIAAAEAYFTSGTGSITGLASTLGDYNEGLIGPGHCK